MRQVNISEARRRLPGLASEVQRTRSEVVITRAGKPVAKLVPVDRSAKTAAYPLRSVPVEIPDDFDEPLPELWDALRS